MIGGLPRPEGLLARFARAARGAARSIPGGETAAEAMFSAAPKELRTATDPAWSDFGGADADDVLEAIKMSGGVTHTYEDIVANAYETMSFELGPDDGTFTGGTADFYTDHAGRFLEDEGFYTETGYSYRFDPSRGGAPVHPMSSSVSTAPADITEMPTSSTDPRRPRTVAAGYDRKRETLTVIFRDGTFYNYYSVSPVEWSSFKRNRSKGWYIRTFLDGKSRGVANMTGLPLAHREALYKTARTAQVRQRGALRPGQSGKVSRDVRKKLASFDYGKRTSPKWYGNYIGTGRYR